MGFRGLVGSLGRVPVLRGILDWANTLREVYGAFDIDPTYHPQRNENRLKEAQRVARLGTKGSDKPGENPDDIIAPPGSPKS